MGLRRRRNREEIENVFEEMIHENFPNLKKETHIQVQKACVCMLVHFSRVQLFVTLWTIAHQSPLSMGFSRQEYWRRLSCPPPGESSQLRDRTQLSRIAGVFFTSWAKWALRYLVSNAAMRLAHLCLHWEHSTVSGMYFSTSNLIADWNTPNSRAKWIIDPRFIKTRVN